MSSRCCGRATSSPIAIGPVRIRRWRRTASVLPEVRAARERGVLFDIAHGMGAFGYETTEGALSHGFPPDLISSDVHVIAVEGPGFDLLHTMSKLLNCGLTLPQVIAMSANRPALAIRRPELGHLGVGAPADITVLRQVDSDYRVRGRGGRHPAGLDTAAAGSGLSRRQADGSRPPAVRGAVHPILTRPSCVMIVCSLYQCTSAGLRPGGARHHDRQSPCSAPAAKWAIGWPGISGVRPTTFATSR